MPKVAVDLRAIAALDAVKLYPLRDVADLLGCSMGSIRWKVRTGKLAVTEGLCGVRGVLGADLILAARKAMAEASERIARAELTPVAPTKPESPAARVVRGRLAADACLASVKAKR